MHHIFQRFVDQLAESAEPNAFQQTMAEAASALELPCFAYLRMPRENHATASLISTYPTRWTDYYLRQHYENIDPVIQLSHARTEPFEWGLGTRRFALTESQKGFFEEASIFGIRCGFTIPIQDPVGPIAAVTFASDQRHQNFRRSIERNGRALQLMAISLHAHARRKLWRDPVFAGAKLRPRELECLRWAAAGKSAWEIGQILGIPERTVKYHWGCVRAKLGVRTVRQAVAIFARAQTLN